MKKMLHLRAVQTLQGNDAAIAEILRALRKTSGNMTQACEMLGVGKSSMYRLIRDLGAAEAVDELVLELGVKIQGKVLTERRTEEAKGPRLRVKPVAA
jgi:DNA-binding phage protein